MDRSSPHQKDLQEGVVSHEQLQQFHCIVMVFLVTLLALVISACSNSNSEPETNPAQIILKLGGEDCEFYLGAVDAALKKLNGMQKVDLSTQKGHAIVITDGTLKTSQVVDTVNGLSGKGGIVRQSYKTNI